MTQIIKPVIKPDFTRKEAEAHTELIVSHANATRSMLLEAFERKAHKAMECGSFEEYAAKYLNMSIDKSNLSHMIAWAKMERNIFGEKVVLQHNFSEGKALPAIPQIEARELVKLPSADLQRIAWERYEGIKEAGVRLPGEYLRGLKNIVSQLLPPKEDAPNVSDISECVQKLGNGPCEPSCHASNHGPA